LKSTSSYNFYLHSAKLEISCNWIGNV